HGVPRAASTVERTEQAKQKELQQIDQYNDLVRLVNTKVSEKQYTAETLALVLKLLTQNPEYYTIWNHRRLILQDTFRNALAEPSSAESSPESTALSPGQQTILDHIVNDLRFLVPLLLKFPKCYWIWNHRLWLLEQSTQHLPASHARHLWQEELGLVGKMLNRDSRNFHGWSYRRIVVAHLEQLPAAEVKGTTSMVEPEFAYTTKMINTNLSNFSAWHNRSKLIPRLLAERNADASARRAFLAAEFAFIQRALYTDPYDQSLWFYHAYLMSTVDLRTPTDARICFELNSGSSLPEETCEEQLESIKDMMDGAEDCKWIYQALLYCALALKAVNPDSTSVSDNEMTVWLAELRKLDPLRSGRWDDLGKMLKL
ncbi:uncharacterized protein K452DRAFT_330663, partial [Aplosporella prunicola CBS 121167]